MPSFKYYVGEREIKKVNTKTIQLNLRNRYVKKRQVEQNKLAQTCIAQFKYNTSERDIWKEDQITVRYYILSIFQYLGLFPKNYCATKIFAKKAVY